VPLNPPLLELAERARALDPTRRVIIGVAGAPGAGKSRLAAELGRALGAPVVPMDGFHLSNAELIKLGRRERKGAPDTFDAAGYLALLRRLRGGDEVWAPDFDRSISEPVENAIRIRAESMIVLTEGNYLLLDDGPWSPVASRLDECWFIEVDEAVRVDRLTARHVEFGRTPVQARQRALLGSDADNARLIAATRSRADLVVTGC
jgi:pantothenate kinase